MTGQHTKPTLAFIVLTVLAAAVIGSQYRADADIDGLVAEHPLSSHSASAPDNIHAGQPAADPRDNAGERAAATSRGGTERGHLPVAAVTDGSRDLAGTHTSQHLDTVTNTDTADCRPRGHRADHPKRSSHKGENGHGRGEHDVKATNC